MHTPGPWKLSDCGLGVWSGNEPLGKNKIVANCHACARSREENRANAALIVLTPELLELAKQVILAKDTEESVPVDIYHAAARLVARSECDLDIDVELEGGRHD